MACSANETAPTSQNFIFRVLCANNIIPLKINFCCKSLFLPNNPPIGPKHKTICNTRSGIRACALHKSHVFDTFDKNLSKKNSKKAKNEDENNQAKDMFETLKFK